VRPQPSSQRALKAAAAAIAVAACRGDRRPRRRRHAGGLCHVLASPPPAAQPAQGRCTAAALRAARTTGSAPRPPPPYASSPSPFPSPCARGCLPAHLLLHAPPRRLAVPVPGAPSAPRRPDNRVRTPGSSSPSLSPSSPVLPRHRASYYTCRLGVQANSNHHGCSHITRCSGAAAGPAALSLRAPSSGAPHRRIQIGFGVVDRTRSSLQHKSYPFPSDWTSDSLSIYFLLHMESISQICSSPPDYFSFSRSNPCLPNFLPRIKMGHVAVVSHLTSVSNSL